MKIFYSIFLSSLLLISFVPTQKTYTRTLKLMGSKFDITVVAENLESGKRYINLAVNEILRIERLISSWSKDSQTSAVNKNAGIKPVKIDDELFQLIKRAIKLSELTDGAFDITYASIDKLWKFDGSMTKKPTEEEINKSVLKIGFKKIILRDSNNMVYLKEKGMKIGFGAIGKGYAADRAKRLLIENGVEAGIINASGDMNTWGNKPNGEYWKVAITNPFNKKKAFALLPVINQSVVTSGSYEKFVKFGGKRYAHIIDPKTGYPCEGIISVTVFAPKAELADALATSVFVMGKEVGLDRINQLPKVECVIVDEKGKLFTSKNIKIDKL